ncbi:kelch motif protein (macronuclear) [Tetrahymena thermophila SB210]|uniref:Kelch motif protein n=1 Tax=Tetrahymena thermophila (strain SB210) TaxID=312017 RepID=Q22BA4_TETTS|nr:kelch motif protein [Tetrahymena thermophila SB210]EAR82549.1 kelch motif protein [Tetrahymena thermophila SB210]|eukprot:XP_001030212.1 kelch motif protein [Tetrahymena thermophila SB210]
MKNLFYKKVQYSKTNEVPRIEEGVSLDYLIDRNKYIYFGGVKPKEVTKDTKLFQNDKDKNEVKTANTINLGQGKNAPTINTTNSIQFKIAELDNPFTLNPALQNNTIHYFDPINQDWTEYECTGKIPSKRIYHQSWYQSPYLFIYGGLSPEKKILNDMYVLNCDTRVWNSFFWYNGPNPPKIYSQLVNMGDRKFVIGGASMPENLLTNEVWSFSLDNMEWDSGFDDYKPIKWEKIDFQDHHLFPPTKAHSAIKISQNQIFIFGGFNQKKQCTDTSIIMDIEKRRIFHFETRGQKPCPRAFHKMLPVKENIICLFGGISCPEDAIKSLTATYLNDFYLLNLNEGYWSRPNCGGYVPTPRYSFAMASNQSEQQGEIIILGGRTLESIGDKQVYILCELESNSEEAYGIIDHEAKLQYDEFREANKKDKNKEKELKNVSMVTLEFSQAEKYIVEQKRKIGELETVYKKLKDSNKQTLENHKIYSDKILQLGQELEDQSIKLTKEIQSKTSRNQQSAQLLTKVKMILAQERKKRKLLELKSHALQDTFKKAESFVVTLDTIYTRGQKDNLFQGLVGNDVLEKIEKQREEHKNQMQDFKQDFEIGISREERIKKNMKQKKESIKQFYNVSQEWKKLLTSDEKLLFPQKIPTNQNIPKQ